MTTRNKFSAEVRERAVRMVGEHRTDYGSAPESWPDVFGANHAPIKSRE